MSRVTPAQTSFNGGEISRRLQARIDQGLYTISLAEMSGFAPLVEGPAEAMPGTIHVAAAPGPCRMVPFEYSATQGHVLVFCDGKVQVYTNDALLVEVDSPYTWEQVQALTFYHSFDAMYCFHKAMQPRLFVRSGAEAFGFELLVFSDGPFEKRNDDEAQTVVASGVSGAVTMASSAPIFEPGDVGGLFQIEAEDLGDITAWEPYVTVTVGQYLNANDRVYRVVAGNPDSEGKIRTGTLTPVHTEGVEWDGMAKGRDINDNQIGGVQLEYIHDRWGVLRITGYTDAMNVSAQVLRRLPFSGTAASYGYTGGYYDEEQEVYVPITPTYGYGTYRWSFGIFSDRNGWPRAGAVWNERLWLATGSRLCGSVAGDLESHAERNEAGEVSDDMGIVAIIQDGNPIEHVVPDEDLLLLTASGIHVLSAASAARGVAPGNIKTRKQPSSGCAAVAAPREQDGRTLFIDRSRSRIYESDIDPGRQIEQPLDLVRYARHIGTRRFHEIAVQREPFNHLWAVMEDGSLACAAYLPEEQVLGFAARELGEGMAARSICTITDPAGHFQQVWLAVEFAGGWHVVRMAPWREDAQVEETACMMDMAASYEGEPVASLTHPLLANRTLDVVADGAFYQLETDADGRFTLPDGETAAKLWAGLPFPAWIESLNLEMGGDNGPARARKAKVGRGWVELILSRGLSFGVPGDMEPLEQLHGGSTMDEGFAPVDGFVFRDNMGDYTRAPRLRIERSAPFQSTISAWGGTLNMEKH